MKLSKDILLKYGYKVVSENNLLTLFVKNETNIRYENGEYSFVHKSIKNSITIQTLDGLKTIYAINVKAPLRQAFKSKIKL